MLKDFGDLDEYSKNGWLAVQTVPESVKSAAYRL